VIRSASDQCPGVIQWVDPGRSRMGVRWDDGTTSMEGTDSDGWEWVDSPVHVCGPECQCPEHGGDTWYHAGSRTHACQRADCRYAVGVEGVLVRDAGELRSARSAPPPWDVPGA
jgi:hypothetical protein